MCTERDKKYSSPIRARCADLKKEVFYGAVNESLRGEISPKEAAERIAKGYRIINYIEDAGLPCDFGATTQAEQLRKEFHRLLGERNGLKIANMSNLSVR